MNKTPTPQQVLADPSTSFWLKDTLTRALTRDLCDAVHDAEILAAVMKNHLRTHQCKPYADPQHLLANVKSLIESERAFLDHAANPYAENRQTFVDAAKIVNKDVRLLLERLNDFY